MSLNLEQSEIAGGRFSVVCCMADRGSKRYLCFGSASSRRAAHCAVNRSLCPKPRRSTPVKRTSCAIRRPPPTPILNRCFRPCSHDGRWAPRRRKAVWPEPVYGDCSQPVAAVPHKPSIGRIPAAPPPPHPSTQTRRHWPVPLIAFATTSIRVALCETSARQTTSSLSRVVNRTMIDA